MVQSTLDDSRLFPSKPIEVDGTLPPAFGARSISATSARGQNSLRRSTFSEEGRNLSGVLLSSESPFALYLHRSQNRVVRGHEKKKNSKNSCPRHRLPSDVRSDRRISSTTPRASAGWFEPRPVRRPPTKVAGQRLETCRPQKRRGVSPSPEQTSATPVLGVRCQSVAQWDHHGPGTWRRAWRRPHACGLVRIVRSIGW